MRLTLFTLTVDRARYAPEAIASVPRAESDDYEHLIVHDGSAGFTDSLKARFPWIRVIEGPGKGPFAAAVLALKEARGDFILPLNSDDLLLPGTLTALLTASAARPDVDVWTGGTRLFEDRPGDGRVTLRAIDDPAATALTPENVLQDLPLMTARFVHRRVYDRLGLLDEAYAGCWDREFALRMALGGVTEAPLGLRVSELRIHDEAMTHRRKGRVVPAYLQGHIALARERLRAKSLTAGPRTVLRDWHAQEVLRLAYFQALSGAPASAVTTCAEGLSKDPLIWVHALSSIKAARLRRRRV